MSAISLNYRGVLSLVTIVNIIVLPNNYLTVQQNPIDWNHKIKHIPKHIIAKAWGSRLDLQYPRSDPSCDLTQL
jgi:hypothetical protein